MIKKKKKRKEKRKEKKKSNNAQEIKSDANKELREVMVGNVFVLENG